jgi:hypothetical protein
MPFNGCTYIYTRLNTSALTVNTHNTTFELSSDLYASSDAATFKQSGNYRLTIVLFFLASPLQGLTLDHAISSAALSALFKMHSLIS